ncbi:MAG: hypothetical protein ABIU09_07425 [Pyrinomonadaceae bacterium]
MVNLIWQTRWQTSATTGYIVQEITTRMSAFGCNGTPLNVPANHYFEAWRITGPNTFDPNAFDYWTIQTGANTRGHWTKTGRVFWVPALDPSWNLSSGRVSHAGSLLSGLSARDLGTVLLTRTIGGTWEGCNGAFSTHGPYNGP